MTYEELIFAGSDEFEVISVDKNEKKVIITVESKQINCYCPFCSLESKSVHSYYFRKLMDLPLLGNETWITLKARKFYCKNDACNRRIFTERFNEHFKSSKRITERVQQKILRVAILMGGNGGEKICRLMNMPVSSSTLIRSIHSEPVPEVKTPRVLGLDDWAFKKRLNYGTILVDLEKRKIIELLPDREALTVENWLKQHPQVEIVSRDRYANYASGVSNALPGAIQVADRWHLIKNLGDAVKRVLQRLQGVLKKRGKLVYQQNPPVTIVKQLNTNRSQAAVGRKQKLIDEVKDLFGQGVGIRAISRQLNLNRNTVRKYLLLEIALPKNAPSRTNFFLFEDYIKNAVATRPGVLIKNLFQEIKDMGYNGKASMGYQNITKYIPAREGIIYPKELPLQHWRPAEVSLFLYRKPQELREKELELINFLRKESADVEICYSLFQQFRLLMENKEGQNLGQWLHHANASSIKEIQSFAKWKIH